MPRSAYHKIANQVADWLRVVDEWNINSSTESITDSLKDIELAAGHEIVSFDVKALYTNVPVNEAISDFTDLLFSGRYKKPPVDKETFKQLLKICSYDVLMLTTMDIIDKQTDWQWEPSCASCRTSMNE